MLMKKYRQQEHIEEEDVARKSLSKSREEALNEKIDRKAQKYHAQKKKKIEKCKTCDKRHADVC